MSLCKFTNTLSKTTDTAAFFQIAVSTYQFQTIWVLRLSSMFRRVPLSDSAFSIRETSYRQAVVRS